MKTVLVLEDEPSVLRLLRRTLEEYCLVEAATAEEALLRFIDRDSRIDLLIADLRGTRRRSPVKSGIEVALLLRSKLPRLPVILTSGSPVGEWSDGDSAALERLGSWSAVILQKPLQAEVLLNAVVVLIHASRTCDATTGGKAHPARLPIVAWS